MSDKIIEDPAYERLVDLESRLDELSEQVHWWGNVLKEKAEILKEMANEASSALQGAMEEWRSDYVGIFRDDKGGGSVREASGRIEDDCSTLSEGQ
jgi:hypothetical protein